MTHDEARRAHYLTALSRLRRSLDHEARSHAGNVGLQIDLVSELISRDPALDDGARERLRVPIDRARNGLTRLLRTGTLVLAALDSSGEDRSELDAREWLRDLEALLAPLARERRVEFSIAVPAAALSFGEESARVREAIAIAAIELLAVTPENGRLAARLETPDGRAVLTFERVHAGSAAAWLDSVRDALAPAGGGLEVGADGTIVLSLGLDT